MTSFHYQRTGGDKPPLMLLHGFGDSGDCWPLTAVHLAPRYDVIMPDARGHGRSPRFQPGEQIDLAADTAEVIQSLGLPPVILLGHSMGAATAALTAAAYPALVRAIILSDPPWFPTPPPLPVPTPTKKDPPQRESEFYIWLRDLQAKSLTEAEAQVRQEYPHWPEAEFAPWAESKHQFDLNFFRYQPDWAWRPWSEYAHQIHCPGLLLRADVDRGSLVTAVTAEAVLQVWTHGRVAYIPHAGHSIRRDNWKGFITAVDNFLHTLPP